MVVSEVIYVTYSNATAFSRFGPVVGYHAIIHYIDANGVHRIIEAQPDSIESDHGPDPRRAEQIADTSPSNNGHRPAARSPRGRPIKIAIVGRKRCRARTYRDGVDGATG